LAYELLEPQYLWSHEGYLAAINCMWFCGITWTEPQNYIYSNCKVYRYLLSWFIYLKNYVFVKNGWWFEIFLVWFILPLKTQVLWKYHHRYIKSRLCVSVRYFLPHLSQYKICLPLKKIKKNTHSSHVSYVPHELERKNKKEKAHPESRC